MAGSNVAQGLLRAAQAYSDEIAAQTLCEQGTSLVREVKWSQVLDQAKSVAAVLKSLVQPRDRVVILGPNSEAYLEVLYGCCLADAVAVPLNTRWTSSELLHAIIDSECSVLVASSHEWYIRAQTELLIGPGAPPGIKAVVEFSHAPASHLLVSSRSISQSSAPDEAVSLELAGKEVVDSSPRSSGCLSELEDAMAIVYTSGTTSKPKGVITTHSSQTVQALGKIAHVGYSSSSVFLNVVPLFHVGGISSTLAITMAGGRHLFLNKFDAKAAVAGTQTGHVNLLVVVPAMLRMMLSQLTDCAVNHLKGVTTVLVGGQGMPTELYEKARRAMPNASFTQSYACTEAGSSMTYQRVRCGEEARQMGHLRGVLVGEAALFAQLRIAPLDPEEAQNRGHFEGQGLQVATEMTSETIGEIETRGLHVMRGYWKQPELTSRVLHDGWLKTGDMGWLENGVFYLAGRIKDMIITGGENVFAAEVEQALSQHSAVAEVAVYGTPDETLGEVVTAAVTLASEKGSMCQNHSQSQRRCGTHQGDIDERSDVVIELDRHCRRYLSGYKCPRRWHIVDDLPRNSSGKVLKRFLPGASGGPSSL
ncbi:unnamed protein product [Chrysoparadoxa australica]